MRRLSTLSFARRLAPSLPGGAKLLDAICRPQTREILESLDTHDFGRFFILAAFQIAKSAIGQVHLARNHWIHPVKTGWYGPTDKFQNDFYRLKLEPLLAASPDLALCKFTKPNSLGRIRPEQGASRAASKGLINPASVDSHKYTVGRHTYTEDGTHQLLSAQTEADRTGRTLQHIYLDEVHLWLRGWIEQISNRRGDYVETQNWKEIFMSTGLTRGDDDTAGAEAAEIWDTTDQRLWHLRCPACGKLSPDRFLHREGSLDPAAIDDAESSGLSNLKSQVSNQRSADRDAPLIGGYFYERAFLENGLPDETRIAATLRWVCPRCSRPVKGARKYEPTCALPDTPATREKLSGTYDHPRGLYLPQNPSPYAAARGWTFTALGIRAWLPVIIRWEKAQLARARGDLEPLAKTIREEFAGIWDPREHAREIRGRPPGGYKMADLNVWGRAKTD